MYSTILVEKAEGWLDIWLNRPTFRNALSTEMVKELLKVLNITKKEGGIRGITLRGKDNIFCAGGDLKGSNLFSRIQKRIEGILKRQVLKLENYLMF